MRGLCKNYKIKGRLEQFTLKIITLLLTKKNKVQVNGFYFFLYIYSFLVVLLKFITTDFYKVLF